MRLVKKVQKVLIGIVAAITVFATGGMVAVQAAGSLKSSTATSMVASNSKSSQQTQGLHLDVKSAIAIDEKTGQILYQQNANQSVPVASLSKLLTLYIVIQAIQNGKLSWDQMVKPSDNVCAVSQDSSLSNVPLEKGKQYSIKALYQATLINSANGAAMALAQAVAGNQKDFVNLMRQDVKKLGVNDAQIYTCNGLTNKLMKSDAYPGASPNAENKFSAKDMALISMKLLQMYPQIVKTSSIKEMNFNTGSQQVQMKNWNWMLPGSQNSYTLLPVDGLKTGTSDAAGACFVGTANKDGHRIITVVLGASHKDGTDPARFIQTQKLMSYIYHTYDYVTLKKGQKTATLPVYHGKQVNVKVANAASEGLWLKKGTKANDVAVKVNVKKSLLNKKGNELAAPLADHEMVGTMKFTVDGQNLETVNGTKCAVRAQTTIAVKKANIFEIAWRWITNLF